jgi:hypothetical protein
VGEDNDARDGVGRCNGARSGVNTERETSKGVDDSSSNRS